jgi:hypothetical protein
MWPNAGVTAFVVLFVDVESKIHPYTGVTDWMVEGGSVEGAAVGDEVGDSVGDTVGDAVGESVTVGVVNGTIGRSFPCCTSSPSDKARL